MQNPADNTPNELISGRLTPIQQVQLQLGLNALVQDDLNLAVRCTTGAQAQLAGDWLQSMLAHRLPHLSVKVCATHEGHRLIEAFNAALTPQTLTQAHQAHASAASQLWLVREDCFERPADLTLMARLLQNFPGTPIRVIFLLAAATGLPSTPSNEASRIHVVTLDDRRTDRPTHPIPPAGMASLRPHVEDPAAAAQTATQAPDLSNVVPGEGPSPLSAVTPAPAHTHRLAIGVALATVLVAGLAWWSQQASRESGSQELASTATATPASSGASESPANEASAAASTPAALASAAATAPAASVASTSTGASPIGAPVPLSSAPVQAHDPAPVASNRTAPAAPAAHAHAALPDRVQKAHRWLARLPQGSFVIEHGRYDTLATAQRSLSGQSHLKEARVLAVQEQENTRYVVVTGPFRSADRVTLHIQRLKLNKAKSHKASVLRGQLRGS